MFELHDMTSFEAIKYVLNGIELHDLQCIDVMRMIHSKRAIVIYPTGKGKTFLASAAMTLLCNEDPKRKFIMLVKKDQLIQTPEKIFKATGKYVLSTSADKRDLQKALARGLDSCSILMITHDCISNTNFLRELYKVKDSFCGIIIDEAHEMNNVQVASSASMLGSLVTQFEYCWALTATPIVTDIMQLAKLACVVDSERFKDFGKLKRIIDCDPDVIVNNRDFFIKRNVEEFGCELICNGIPIFVEPQPEQQDTSLGGNQLELVCKGPGAENQVKALVRTLKLYGDKRGLIYVNQHAVRGWILPFLDDAGIKYACINGATSAKDRTVIMHKFNVEKSLDVVITSVTTAIDLDCDFVIFYEFTVDVKQMIGRAYRGLGDKVLDVLFVITDDSNEVDYFCRSILARSLMIRRILGINCEEVSMIADELVKRI